MTKKPAPAPPLLPLRTLLILFMAAIIGGLVGVATWFAAGQPWVAVLAGGAAAVGAVDRLHVWAGN